MLVLRRKEGEWIEVTHAASGDVLRFRSYDIRPGGPNGGHVNLAFDDPDRHFQIERPERGPRHLRPDGLRPDVPAPQD